MTKIYIKNKETKEMVHLFVRDELEFKQAYDMVDKTKYEIEKIEVKDVKFIGVDNADDANYLDLPWC